MNFENPKYVKGKDDKIVAISARNVNKKRRFTISKKNFL